MATRNNRTVPRLLQTLFNLGAIRELTDGQLLERFATGPGEVGELAFAALVERHGPMVQRVCQGVLRDPHDTQDAFQATFLVLVKKARGLWVRESLGPWLHQVAFRTATCARSAAARRKRHEQRAAELAPLVQNEDAPGSSLEPLLHAEINRLPERYRVPIVLCDLQGHTCDEAARQMGRPVGTVKSWRARGRERLRQRLTRSGLSMAAGLENALAATKARAIVPRSIAEVTAGAAVRCFTGGMTAGEIPASVRSLVKGVLEAMLMNKVRSIATSIVALTFLTAGLGAVARVASDELAKAPEPPRNEAPAPSTHLPGVADGEAWPLSLREAIRLGLDHSEIVRVISAKDGILMVARLNNDATLGRFRSGVMAEVRSIEQLYWTLSQRCTELWAAEQAVTIAEELLKRLEAELKAGRGDKANLAAVQQRLQEFRLILAVRTGDLINSERQLREAIGLPQADGRRIVPSSAPTEAQISPDWNKCLATMLEKQPEITAVRVQAEESERVLVALRELGKTAGQDPAARKMSLLTPTREAQYREQREKAHLQHTIDGMTHELSRYVALVDGSFQQFQTAARARASAAERLESQRAFYEKGRISVDRYCDAIRQYVDSVAMEAQFNMSYNNALVALEEAKGTLLERERIGVDESVRPAVSTIEGSHGKPTALLPQPAARPAPPVMPTIVAPPANPAATGAGSSESAAGKTFSFHVTLGNGPHPVEIRGSFTIAPARPDKAVKTP